MTNKIAIVTGGSHCLGRNTALNLARRDASCRPVQCARPCRRQKPVPAKSSLRMPVVAVLWGASPA